MLPFYLQLDVKGKMSYEAVKIINYTQAALVSRIAFHVSAVEQNSRILTHSRLTPPFEATAVYSHNFSEATRRLLLESERGTDTDDWPSEENGVIGDSDYDGDDDERSSGKEGNEKGSPRSIKISDGKGKEREERGEDEQGKGKEREKGKDDSVDAPERMKGSREGREVEEGDSGEGGLNLGPVSNSLLSFVEGDVVTVLATDIPNSALKAAGVVAHSRGHYWLGSDKDGRIGLFDADYVRFPNTSTLSPTSSTDGTESASSSFSSLPSVTPSSTGSSPLTLSSSPQPTPSLPPQGQGYNAIVNHYLSLVDLLSSDMDLAIAFVNNPSKEMTEHTAKYEKNPFALLLSLLSLFDALL